MHLSIYYFCFIIFLSSQFNCLAAAQIPVGHEKFLDGLAGLILSMTKETVTITEQSTVTLSLTDTSHEYTTHVQPTTRTHSTTFTNTITAWTTLTSNIIKTSTTYVTDFKTRTENITIYSTSTLTESELIRLVVHSRTISLAALSITSTTMTTETSVSEITDNRNVYETVTSIKTSYQVRRQTERQLEFETTSQTVTITLEQRARAHTHTQPLKLTTSLVTLIKPTTIRPTLTKTTFVARPRATGYLAAQAPGVTPPRQLRRIYQKPGQHRGKY